MLNQENIVDAIVYNKIKGGSGGGRLPDYGGSYSVTPKVTEQVLPTKDRSMLDDITIFQVPFQETDNPSGGKTVVIGLE